MQSKYITKTKNSTQDILFIVAFIIILSMNIIFIDYHLQILKNKSFSIVITWIVNATIALVLIAYAIIPLLKAFNEKKQNLKLKSNIELPTIIITTDSQLPKQLKILKSTATTKDEIETSPSSVIIKTKNFKKTSNIINQNLEEKDISNLEALIGQTYHTKSSTILIQNKDKLRQQVAVLKQKKLSLKESDNSKLKPYRTSGLKLIILTTLALPSLIALIQQTFVQSTTINIIRSAILALLMCSLTTIGIIYQLTALSTKREILNKKASIKKLNLTIEHLVQLFKANSINSLELDSEENSAMLLSHFILNCTKQHIPDSNSNLNDLNAYLNRMLSLLFLQKEKEEVLTTVTTSTFNINKALTKYQKDTILTHNAYIELCIDLYHTVAETNEVIKIQKVHKDKSLKRNVLLAFFSITLVTAMAITFISTLGQLKILPNSISLIIQKHHLLITIGVYSLALLLAIVLLTSFRLKKNEIYTENQQQNPEKEIERLQIKKQKEEQDIHLEKNMSKFTILTTLMLIIAIPNTFIATLYTITHKNVLNIALCSIVYGIICLTICLNITHIAILNSEAKNKLIKNNYLINLQIYQNIEIITLKRHEQQLISLPKNFHQIRKGYYFFIRKLSSLIIKHNGTLAKEEKQLSNLKKNILYLSKEFTLVNLEESLEITRLIINVLKNIKINTKTKTKEDCCSIEMRKDSLFDQIKITNKKIDAFTTQVEAIQLASDQDITIKCTPITERIDLEKQAISTIIKLIDSTQECIKPTAQPHVQLNSYVATKDVVEKI